MADNFVEVEVETDEQTLADAAVAYLQSIWPDWTPSDGDLDVVMIEALAPMAADANLTASQVPAAVFRTILEKLHNVLKNDGTAATGTVTFTLTDTDAHTIEAGFAIDIDGVEFTVDADTDTAALTAAAVPVTASTVGTIGNALAGDVVTPITSASFVSSVSLDAPTAGGTEPEDDADYQDRGARELELQAKTLVTARDYELEALNTTGIGRAVASSDGVTRTITVTVADVDGEVVAAGIKTDLATTYDELRQTTWAVAVGDPTYTVITVTVDVHPYPGYDAADLEARITTQLDGVLDPSFWGTPSAQGDVATTQWVSDARVRVNKLIDLIGDVAGVDYVNTLTLSGDVGTVEANGDWTMAGTVALPRSGTHVVTVT